MAERFSLKDHLFNPETVAQLASEYSSALPGFDGARFSKDALDGFADRELMARLDWLADCIETQLSNDFPQMAAQLEAAMPPRLDPALSDDDFGHFIHAVPGILAVRHGLEAHRDRALDLLYSATQRFSMEYYIRPFLNRWPEETLARLHSWAKDENYHVRRLVSEGTRPKLPWAKSVQLKSTQTIPLLDLLHTDTTRYVTRSVANHLNDIAKAEPDLVVAQLETWTDAARQDQKELNWMRRHALRTLVKSGHAGALAALGFSSTAPVDVKLLVKTPTVGIGGCLDFSCALTAPSALPVLVDYRISFARPDGRPAEKVFKLKQSLVKVGQPLTLTKSHRLKADATTFKWHPGAHTLTIQVNGVDRAKSSFEVTV